MQDVFSFYRMLVKDEALRASVREIAEQDDQSRLRETTKIAEKAGFLFTVDDLAVCEETSEFARQMRGEAELAAKVEELAVSEDDSTLTDALVELAAERGFGFTAEQWRSACAAREVSAALAGEPVEIDEDGLAEVVGGVDAQLASGTLQVAEMQDQGLTQRVSQWAIIDEW